MHTSRTYVDVLALTLSLCLSLSLSLSVSLSLSLSLSLYIYIYNTHTPAFLLRIGKTLISYHPQIWGYEKVGSHIDFTLLPQPAYGEWCK